MESGHVHYDFLATNICLDHRLLLSLLSKKHGSHLYSLCISNSLYHESKLKKNADVCKLT